MKDLCGGLFVWYTSGMNKALNLVSASVVILSVIGIAYLALTPTVNYCAAPNPGELGTAECVFRKSTNWTGIGILAITLGSGIAFTVRRHRTYKKK
jgi:hypothetical protein